MHLPRTQPILRVRADETRNSNGTAVREQLGDLPNAPDVLVPIFLAEAEVLVQTEAHVVAVEAVSREAEV